MDLRVGGTHSDEIHFGKQHSSSWRGMFHCSNMKKDNQRLHVIGRKHSFGEDHSFILISTAKIWI